MDRIEQKFIELKNSARKGFIPFVTAGDPDLKTSLSIIEALAKLGADIIELGVPFSDPMADGLAIQEAGQRALKGGMTLRRTLALVRELRRVDAVESDV